MGIVRMSVNQQHTLFLKNCSNSKIFIETGTFMGSTAKWGQKHFENVITIENSEDIYKQIANELNAFSNVKAKFGNSKNILSELEEIKESNVIYWLDAHWCGGLSYGEFDQCPLVEELEIIKKNGGENPIIMIDDARLFLSPPPAPNRIDEYPNILQICEPFKNTHIPYIFEDVIYIIPSKYAIEFAKLLQTEASDKLNKEYELNKNKWLNIKIKLAEIKNLIFK